MKNDIVTFGVLNDKFMVGLIGLVPARLLRSHSLQCVCASFAAAVLSVGVIFENLTFHKVVCRHKFELWSDL